MFHAYLVPFITDVPFIIGPPLYKTLTVMLRKSLSLTIRAAPVGQGY